jgi:endonuclease YncB( thermonuclease family)
MKRSAGSPARTRRPRSAAYLVTALALGFAHGAAGAEVSGVPRVIDGATLEVAEQRIRLFGIAAPALEQVCQHGGRDYPCGKVARAALWDLVAGLEVICKTEAAAPPPDDPLPATCTAGGVDLNQSMVNSGWALADRRATDRYVTSETAAKEARRGLWKGKFVPRWEWRATPAATEPPAEDGSSR